MKKNSNKTFALLVLLFIVTSFIPVWAAEMNTPAPDSQMDYGTGVGKKLGRGLSNLGFGWLELPKGIQDVGDQRNFFAGITWGPIYGAGKTIARTLAGAYEVVTFPIPFPSHFEPLVKPEFVLEDQR